ncbi:MAG: P1 family peptidase [Gemmatimonadetes bacterium]|nr:P1 family peptidase [Gemmatimonadota bacterium]
MRWTAYVGWSTPALALAVSIAALDAAPAVAQERPRARELGIAVGELPPGRWNAITDVPGVRVGHATVVEGDSIRTGVTAIRPHPGDVFAEKVPAAIHIANGFGKLTGISQVFELGTIETPIVLTNTLAVGRAADGLVRWTLANTREPGVRSVNPVVGETNDGFLNAIIVPRVGPAEVAAALEVAADGPVEEGSVGAGTGTTALGFKGGIGTASRRFAIGDATYTLGVLVQSNFGGALEIAGVPVGRSLGVAGFIDRWLPPPAGPDANRAVESEDLVWDPAVEPDRDGGSIMIVVATDAPVDARGLERIAKRAPYAIGRVGGFSSHGSGDYVIAFSTAEGLRVPYAGGDAPTFVRETLRGEALNPLFRAVIEATEEAILNSLTRATTVEGWRGRVEALPIEAVRELLEEHEVVDRASREQEVRE